MTEPLIYGYAGAAEIVGIVSAEYLAKHKTKLPHTQIGRNVGFTLAQLIEITEMHAVRPEVTPAAEPAAPAPTPLAAIRPRGAARLTG